MADDDDPSTERGDPALASWETEGGRLDGSPAQPSASGPSNASPHAVRSYRSQLSTGEDVVDPATWAGSVPVAHGIAPRVRIGRSRWFTLLWLVPIGLLGLAAAVAAAKGLRGVPSVAGFIEDYPGTVFPAGAERNASLPIWVGAMHFLNLFLMIFIIRSGLQILTDHPRLYWTRHSTPGRDWFRIQKPVPADPLWTAKNDSISLPGQVGLPGIRHSIGLARWWHLGIDVLWLANGLAFLVLLFATSQWQRVVPTSWDVLPNAASVAIQYLSLDWPTENGWVAYNSLQLIAYFITIFVAAPLALVTGLGMSPALSTRFKRISKVFSIQTARSLHFLVLVWFLGFIVTHVTLAFATGALRNLNHIYAAQDGSSWTGFWIFAASMVVVIVGWVGATPFTLRHPRVVQRVGYALIGPVQRLFEHVDATPGEYTEKDISPYLWHNGQYPDSDEYTALFDGDFADYRLRGQRPGRQPRRPRPAPAASAARHRVHVPPEGGRGTLRSRPRRPPLARGHRSRPRRRASPRGAYRSRRRGPRARRGRSRAPGRVRPARAPRGRRSLRRPLPAAPDSVAGARPSRHADPPGEGGCPRARGRAREAVRSRAR